MTSETNVEEEELIGQVKAGDQMAFHRLYEKYQGNLFKFVHYRTGDYALAQDIVQETFVRVWTSRDTLKPNLGFFALIARISQNLAQDHYKHMQVRNKHADYVKFLTDRPGGDPEDDLNLNQLQQRIHEVAERDLPNKCRTIFILSRASGMSNQEIADALQITKKTVENQLHHALQVLRKKCAEYL